MKNKNLIYLVILSVFVYFNTLDSYAQWSTNGSSIVYTNDNVGIGTSSPSRKLTLSGSTKPYMSFKPTSTNNEFVIGSDESGFIVYDDTYNQYRFAINKNGNIGIGTTSPLYKLHVNGSLLSTSLSTGSLTATSADVNGDIDCYNLDAWLDVSCSALDATWYVDCYQLRESSDIKLKENIGSLDNSLGKLIQLQGKTYNFKNSPELKSSGTPKKEIGFLAQDLQKVFPELVGEDKDGLLSIRYTGLIPVLVEALKEQQSQIDELKSTITEMSNMISQNNSMYPNPFGTQINLDLALQSNVKKAILKIYDLNGKLIKQIDISDRGNTLISFDTSDLPAGVYTYNLIGDGNLIASSKMIKQ